MTRTFSRLGGLVAVGFALATGGLTSGASALASTVGPTKIAPHQVFAGLVNGLFDNAIVKVVCPISGTHGRVLDGQTISVTSPTVIAKNFGNTGSKGRAIAANVGPAASTAETVIFKKYNHPQEFPTNIPVPCGGTTVIVFAPVPSSHGSKPGTVTVTWANVSAGG